MHINTDELFTQNKLDHIADLLVYTNRQGPISTIPVSITDQQTQATKGQLSARVKTIRTYLYLLGYLTSDSGKHIITSGLRSAIKQFQHHAGLTSDAWVGPITWRALICLVSFESPTYMRTWFANIHAVEAVNRAIALRLSALGFLSFKHRLTPQWQLAALNDFKAIAIKIKLLNTSNTLTKLMIVTQLFNQDAIIAKLAEYQNTTKRTLPLAVNIAKIELFLLGNKVTPSASRHYRPTPQDLSYYKQYKRGVLPKSVARTKTLHLYHALVNFWRSQGKSLTVASRLAKDIDHRFISALHQLNELPPPTEQHNSDIVHTTLTEVFTGVERQQVWTHMQTIGSRIFDGIKRLANWFIRLFKRSKRLFIQATKNIARLAHMYAKKAFVQLTSDVNLAVAAMQFVWQKPSKSADVNSVIIERTSDINYTVLINTSATKMQLRQKIDNFTQHLLEFKLGMKAIQRFIYGLKLAARISTGGLGIILALINPTIQGLKRIGIFVNNDA